MSLISALVIIMVIIIFRVATVAFPVKILVSISSIVILSRGVKEVAREWMIEQQTIHSVLVCQFVKGLSILEIFPRNLLV